MKIGSLCTGYGGLDLAVEAHFDAKTVWCAEFDKYASQVIEQRFNIPNYKDIKTIDWASVEPIDILTAGYPCQPFSHAGYRKGTEDERHLFPYILEAISILRPKLVILENVRGHLSLGLKEVLQGLAITGYDAKWQVVRASDVGAPHRRERVFIFAQPTNTDRERFPLGYIDGDEVGNQGQSQSITCRMGSIASDSINDRSDKCITSGHQEKFTAIESDASNAIDSISELKPSIGRMQRVGRKFTSRREMYLQTPPLPLDKNGRLNALFVEYMMGLPKGWVTETGLSRAQQLKMLGNGVVPQQAEYAIELLCDTHSDRHFY